jgi:hypothetical protein
MLIVTGQQSEGDPYETLTQECSGIVSEYAEDRHESFLAGPPFSGMPCRKGVRWTPRWLVYTAILMAWAPGRALCDRFTEVRAALVGMFPGRRRPGKTHPGFVEALRTRGSGLLWRVQEALRSAVRATAGAYWRREGHLAFAVDGSRVDCPRTRANEEALGCGGRKGTGPQFWLTTLWHMGTGLPWAWKTGPSRDAERTHLREMLDLLPRGALLVADAGFTGYELFREILSSGRSLLIRVGANVSLLRKLGYAEVESDGTVYLWPQAFQKDCPPVVLRLIVLRRKGKKMYLLTNLTAAELPRRRAAVLYEMRWGVEVFFRSLKETLSHRKMLSHGPRQAQAELEWTLVGLQVLGLMSVEQILAGGHDPLSWSVASALRAVRQAMQDRKPTRHCPGGLDGALGRSVKDRYHRRGSKKAFHWPHKKKQTPPGGPKMRNAKPKEIKKAQRIADAEQAA